MALTRLATRMVARQLMQLEKTAIASAVALQTTGAQTAGISSLSHASVSKQVLSSTVSHSWHTSATSSSSSSSSGVQWVSQRSYSQCDCPPLGGPQPDIVVVEYDEEEVDRFIALADAIEAAYPNIVVEGNPDGEGRPGSFEIKDQNGQVLFSRLDGGGWPEADTVVDALAAACSTAAAAAEKTG